MVGHTHEDIDQAFSKLSTLSVTWKICTIVKTYPFPSSYKNIINLYKDILLRKVMTGTGV